MRCTDAGRDPKAITALELLKAWDGQMAADSIGASVYQAFSAALTRRLAQAKAPRAWPWAIGQGFSGGDVVKIPFSTPDVHTSLTDNTLLFPAGVAVGANLEAGRLRQDECDGCRRIRNLDVILGWL